MRPYGERGWMIEGETSHLLHALEGQPGLVEFVPGAESVLLLFEEKKEREEVAGWLGEIEVVERDRVGRLWEIPVSYTGADLAGFSEKCGLTSAEVVRLHSAPVYEVAFMGFSPGFPYLSGLDKRLHLPRKEVPVPEIKPGSVAVGGGHAGIYSVASPGGWHVLGHTEVVLFRPEEEKFLFSPGDRVKFLAI